MAQQQPPVPVAANDELALLRQRLEDETRRRQEAERQLLFASCSSESRLWLRLLTNI